MMAIPTLIFGLVVLSVLPSTVLTLIMVMGLLDSTRVYRLSRAVAVDINVMDYVEAAKLRGEGTGWIIFREILPNALSPLVSELGLRFIYAVLFLSALSFLGLGVQPPAADWGGMVKENKEGIVFGIPAALIPAAAIAALAISVNLVADWVLNRTTSLKGGRGGRQIGASPARYPRPQDRGHRLSAGRRPARYRHRRWRLANLAERQGARPDRRIRRRQIDHRPVVDGLRPRRRPHHRRRSVPQWSRYSERRYQRLSQAART
jgi:hypothetical protein